jgi:transcriptional regulator of acetoin/glycerol metabolism
MGDSEPAIETEPMRVEAVPPSPAIASLTPAEREDRQRIIEVLDRCAGNQTAAARILKISRSTLIDRLKQYGIRRPQVDRGT